jgi:hypothetical protein
MRRNIAAACVVAFAFSASAYAPTSFAEDETPPAPTNSTNEVTTVAPTVFIGRYLLADIVKARREVWRWERLMRVRFTKPTRVAEQTQDADQRRAILDSWKRKAAARKRQAYSLRRMGAWLCIKRYEAAWNDPRPPYYGGLQMDLAFQRTYGPDLLRKKGTADRWSPIEQIWVAERAYRSGRGFYPWPNTARACGLI